ncbi:MAG TPA: MarR family transcriptional regulator [Steroidobacteraceae bacterium]|nr:MarR family transcriptional regulator [Steroidobacteraceae bacterium]
MNTFAYLGFALEEAGRVYLRRFEERTRDFALEPMGCKALLVLAENEGVTQQRLSELTMLDPVAIGRILERLEAEGLVARRPRPGDGRARAVVLTRKAVEMLPNLWQAVKESLREALTGMATTEKRVLMGALQRVVSNLSTRIVDDDVLPAFKFR